LRYFIVLDCSVFTKSSLIECEIFLFVGVAKTIKNYTDDGSVQTEGGSDGSNGAGKIAMVNLFMCFYEFDFVDLTPTI
jgi:hypothetical protein